MSFNFKSRIFYLAKTMVHWCHVSCIFISAALNRRREYQNMTSLLFQYPTCCYIFSHLRLKRSLIDAYVITPMIRACETVKYYIFKSFIQMFIA